MSHYEYYSTMRSITESMRASHIKLIENICNDLGESEKIPELTAKYIGRADRMVRIKKFKDPDAPKKAMSGYMWYCKKRRVEGVQTENPDASFADIIRTLAKEWEQLNDTSRSEYLQLAEEDKDRYERQVEEYKQAREAERFKSNVGSSA